MILNLVLKYLVYNRKHSLKAFILMSLGLAIILSTNIMITGFIIEIQNFSKSLNTNNLVVEISPQNRNEFSNNTFNSIMNIINGLPKSDINFYLDSFDIIAPLYQQNYSLGSYSISITNITKVFKLGLVYLLSKSDNKTISISNSLPSIESKPSYIIQLGGNNYTINQFDKYGFNRLISSDILIDRTNPYFSAYESRFNKFYIALNTKNAYNSIITSFNKLSAININTQNPQSIFLQNSTASLSEILYTMQLVMSILLIASISYVMLNLVHETRNDLKIIHSLGIPKYKVWLLFQLQSIIISFLASIFSLILSVILLEILVIFTSISLHLPFFTIVVSYRYWFNLMIQSVIIGLFAGIYPSYQGIRN